MSPRLLRWSMGTCSCFLKRLQIMVAAGALLPGAGEAQDRCPAAVRPVQVGSEWEQYLRVLQNIGVIRGEPWTIRAFTARQTRAMVPTDSTLPWPASAISTRCAGRLRVSRLPVELDATYNTTYPYGGNDGPVWAGRGLTVAGTAGLVGTLGPLTVILAPTAFAAQNSGFRMQANGLTGPMQFADWRFPARIDLPQRFGDGAYAEVSPGQSSAELDLRVMALGFSTANQYWGPATDHPILLGNNAAGFAHAYVQTATPLHLKWIGHVHGRVFYGSLGESPYSALADSSFVRLASGLVGVLQPVILPNVEIGFARFFQTLQRTLRFTTAELARPFGGLFNSAAPELAGDQLVSIFGRIQFPESGLEAYVEFGREDASQDMRDFLLMPDHDASYLLGLRKVWRRPSDIVAIRAEVLNTRVTHLALASSQDPWYVHSKVLQGFTHRGQVLGAPAAYGGGGSLLAIDRYDRRGRTTIRWDRVQLAERIDERAPDLPENDVAHVLGMNRLRFGVRADVEWGLAAVYEFNRHFASDVFNLQATARISAPSLRAAH